MIEKRQQSECSNIYFPTLIFFTDMFWHTFDTMNLVGNLISFLVNSVKKSFGDIHTIFFLLFVHFSQLSSWDLLRYYKLSLILLYLNYKVFICSTKNFFINQRKKRQLKKEATNNLQNLWLSKCPYYSIAKGSFFVSFLAPFVKRHCKWNSWLHEWCQPAKREWG